MRLLLAAACATALALVGLACHQPDARPARDATPVPKGTLDAFASQAEFDALLARWRAQAEARARREQRSWAGNATSVMAPPPAAAAPAAESSASDSVQVTGARVGADGGEASITNNQVQGVDEGDIVKKAGDHLIVLRRGRLFTVRIGGDVLKPVSMIDAYAPGSDPSGTWYDEMLVGNGTVAVIGFSYARGGTEVGLFDLDARGALRHRDTYHLRSNDYYSARNYASRLVGDTLVFYTPMHLNTYGGEVEWPALRRWHRDATPAEFRRLLPATRIYRADDDLDPRHGVALHTVTRCSLATRAMQCESTAVLGPPGRVFHVSGDAVYVWTSAWRNDVSASSVVRMPLDGGAPSALRTLGSPVDQMAFLQRDGFLNVLVTGNGGEGMWASERDTGALALLRVPLSRFGDVSARAPRSAYRPLPATDGAGSLHNRFVGDWLLYGAGDAWNGESRGGTAHAVRYATHAPVAALSLTHDVERIDALGNDALLVGSRGRDLQFTTVALDANARVAAVYTQPDAQQGDDRTHGFFYKPQDAATGVAGLPILRGDAHASVLYLRNAGRRLSRMGTLDATHGPRRDDACKASCVDWYGNSRPIFIGERVFALLGYELVEGRLGTARIHERRRIDFAPAIPGVAVAE